jgi:translation initiation factor 2B subunit (eIF-2B alpha/beta/delta family)
VEYGIDMALFERLPEAQVMLVGADAVFPHGVVNKLGTHALVQLAQLHHLPVYSLCATNKFLPADAASLLHIAEHPGDEVWPEAPTTVQVPNRYFDTTPLSLFTGIISDLALYTPAALALELQRLPLASALQQLASR